LRMLVEVPHDGCAQDIVEAIAAVEPKLASTSSDGKDTSVLPVAAAAAELLMCDTEQGYIYSLTQKRKHVTRIRESSLMVYRVPGLSNRSSDQVLINLVHRKLKNLSPYFLVPHRPALFHEPCIALMRNKCTKVELYRSVWALVARLVPEYESMEEDLEHPWPFMLRRVARDGQLCTRCSWLEGCTGCAIEEEADGTGVDLEEEETLAIDWDSSVVERFFSQRAVAPKEHPSIAEYHERLAKPMALEDCLQSFTKEEKIEAYCPKCTKAKGGEFTETNQTKTLQVWATPSLLVVQLKRFKTDRHSRGYKLNNLVTFPVSDFDLSPCIAEELHREVQAGNEMARSSGLQSDDNESSAAGPKKIDRKRSEPILAEAESIWGPDLLRRDGLMYDLYAVSHHSGSLNGGHYTSHAKVNGQWMNFNDSNVSPATEASLQSATAYILFYVRRDVNCPNASIQDLYPTYYQEEVDIEKIRQTKWVPPAKTMPRSKTKKQDASACTPGGCCTM